MRITREEAESELRWAKILAADIARLANDEDGTPEARANAIIYRITREANRLSAYTIPPKPLD